LKGSAKSSLLNALFGTSFRTAAARKLHHRPCTRGMCLSTARCHYAGHTRPLVIIDTEGMEPKASSSKRASHLFDNQLATMAILVSHLVIVNHKLTGQCPSSHMDLDSLERLLGITFHAKAKTSSTFKPTVLFVLRELNHQTEISADHVDHSVVSQVGLKRKCTLNALNMLSNQTIVQRRSV
jgi:hypothetical protein